MADLEEDVQITPNKISNTNCCIKFDIKPVKSKILLNPQNCVREAVKNVLADFAR